MDCYAIWEGSVPLLPDRTKEWAAVERGGTLPSQIGTSEISGSYGYGVILRPSCSDNS